MPLVTKRPAKRLTGHALRDFHLREHSLRRAQTAPPLARLLVTIRAKTLCVTRLEFSRRSGISRGTLRDLELGIHSPTRKLLQRLMAYYRRCRLDSTLLDEVRQKYAGPRGTLTELIAWLEVQAGSARELARRVKISPSTLWEYRRGRFPLPLLLLHQLCKAVGEDASDVESLWLAAERNRLLERGYPEPLADFWAMCHRAGLSEKDLPRLGVGTAALRQLRYLEVPRWEHVATAAKKICRDDVELNALKHNWSLGNRPPVDQPNDDFGPRLLQLRKARGISRRELADLFGIGGKKPAQSVKQIEECGAYSANAYPAGIAAILTDSPEERADLVRRWSARRARFLQRHRPETWVKLRLRREAYGFEITEMEPILGYSSLEFQRIERGVMRLSALAQARVLAALEQAGEDRLAALIAVRRAEVARREGWHEPTSISEMVSLLVEREGGLVPFTRYLKKVGVNGIWPGRVKAIVAGTDIPPWPIVERIGKACGVKDFTAVRADWQGRYRNRLEELGLAPLGVEVRLLIAEVATSARAISPKLGVSYPVLTRDLKRIDAGKPVRWRAVERILKATGVDPAGPSWERIEAWWHGSSRRK
ncbi:MAG: XRE family transcriptional regulator [Gemmataceae bacterium]|nr:XRE family transcriptional regulator [Gemmataceae bacterium]